MKIKKFDFSNSMEDIFYKIIYPLYAREFLFGTSYEEFILIVKVNFILNSQQENFILEHWEKKERILTVEEK